MYIAVLGGSVEEPKQGGGAGFVKNRKKFGKWKEKGVLLKWRVVCMDQRTPKSNSCPVTIIQIVNLLLSSYPGNTLMPLMVTNMPTEES